MVIPVLSVQLKFMHINFLLMVCLHLDLKVLKEFKVLKVDRELKVLKVHKVLQVLKVL